VEGKQFKLPWYFNATDEERRQATEKARAARARSQRTASRARDLAKYAEHAADLPPLTEQEHEHLAAILGGGHGV
jgi:hypothetical protein